MFTSPVLYFIKFGKNFYEKKERCFLAYLGLITLVELFNLCYKEFVSSNGEFTNFIYNVLVFFEYNLIFLFYKEVSNEKQTKLYLKIALTLFNLGYFISVFYYGKEVMVKYMNYILVHGSFLVSVVFVLYLREFLLSDKILNYQKDITFWITVGFLLYYLGTIPLTAAYEFVYINNNINAFNIQVMLTIIMHVCFIFGIIKCWKKIR